MNRIQPKNGQTVWHSGSIFGCMNEVTQLSLVSTEMVTIFGWIYHLSM